MTEETETETKPYPTDYTFKLIYSDGSEEDELPPSAVTALNDWIELLYEEDICCECGESVAPGSGKFVNRIPEMSGILARVDGNRPHPTGAWVCAECEMRIEKDCIDEEECLLDTGGDCADCQWNTLDEDVPVEEDVRVE